MAQQSLLKSLLVVSAIIVIVSLFPAYSFCEIQTITHTVKQPFGGSQSPDDARISAIAKAKREALEIAGVYIESLTVVKNSQVDKDEILALTAGVLKAEVVSQKNYHTDDAFGIDVVVKVVVDTSVLESRVKKLLQDRTYLNQLNQARKREKELLQKVAKLEKQNRKPTQKKQSASKLKEQFQQASRGLTAVEWFNKALSLMDEGKYADPEKAIEYLNNAIKLQPDIASAYYNRGLMYSRLKQYQHAIEDYNQAVRLQPDEADTYGNRGNAYGKLGQHNRAIEDYNQAIRLQPDHPLGYNNRGIAYDKLGQHQRAIADHNEAIRLKPDYADAYDCRGIAYGKLGQYQRAIDDFNQAIHLQPDYADAYYNRGLMYSRLKQHQRAIEDYNEAIRLKPDFADAFNNRGTAYILSVEPRQGCKDLQTACGMGDCKGLEYIRSQGICR